MSILNKDTSEERRTGQHSGATGAGDLPRLEDYSRHFAERFRDAGYFRAGNEWEDYQPAYQFGYESFERYRGRDFAEIEPELAQGWNTTRRASRLGWSEARDAVRDGWAALDRGLPGERTGARRIAE